MDVTFVIGTLFTPVSYLQSPLCQAYAITVYSLDRPSFSVTAKCRFGNGQGRAIACRKNGEAFQLEGCGLGECTSPMKEMEDGYVVQLGYVQQGCTC